MWFKSIIFSIALRLALRKPHPRKLTYGIDNDFIYFRMHPNKECHYPHFVAHSRDHTAIHVITVSGRGKVTEGERISRVAAMGLRHQIEQIYKGQKFRYRSLAIFIAFLVFRIPFLLTASSALAQWRFNRSAPVTAHRQEILRTLIEMQLDERSKDSLGLAEVSGVGSISLMQRLYGNRIFAHPRFSRLHAELDLALDSLVDSKEVEDVESGYRVTGRALATLLHLEEAELRHRDQIRISSRIVTLTFALVIVGVLQIPSVQSVLGIN